MTIKGLKEWLVKKYPHIFYNEIPLSCFEGQRISVDASIFLYKYLCVSAEKYFDLFVNLIMCLRKNKIRPFFVFDGKAPIQKARTQKKRRAARARLEGKYKKISELIEEIEDSENIKIYIENISEILEEDVKDWSEKLIKDKLYERQKKLAGQCIKIEKNHIEKIQLLLDHLGLPYITAPDNWEAEKYCSYLVNKKFVKAVLTSDSDAIAYCAKIIINKLDTATGKCTIIKISDVLKNIGMSREKFKDFCICCGTDYNENMPNLGPAKIFTLFQKYDKIEDLEKSGYPTDILFYEESRNLFTFIDIEIDIPPIKNIDYKQLTNLFLKCNSKYTTNIIRKMIPKPVFKIEE